MLFFIRCFWSAVHDLLLISVYLFRHLYSQLTTPDV
nr:MAG TPA: hypothetical protein [Caudoviricetes sp.]